MIATKNDFRSELVEKVVQVIPQLQPILQGGTSHIMTENDLLKALEKLNRIYKNENTNNK